MGFDPISGFFISLALNYAVSAIFGTGQDIEGPRLGDLATTTSQYGTPIPRVWGNVRISGQVIWGLPLREEKREDDGPKKGGGGKAPSVTTYHYFGSWAVGLCVGPQTIIRRVWFDRNIVFDTNLDEPNPKGINFRFYTGSEEQLPDPLIEADKGEGLTPAFRGLCYIVFDDVYLADFGNRIPSVEVELVNEYEYIDSFAEYDLISGGFADDFSTNIIVPNYTLGIFYISDQDDSALRTFSVGQEAEIRQINTLNSEMSSDAWGYGPYISYTREGTNTRPIIIADAVSGATISTFGTQDNGLQMFPDGDGFIATTVDLCCITFDLKYNVIQTIFGQTGVTTCPSGTFVYSENGLAFDESLGPCSGTVNADEETEFYIARNNVGKIMASGDTFNIQKCAAKGTSLSLREDVDLTPGGLGCSAGATFGSLAYDKTDDTVILILNGTPGVIAKIHVPTATIMWRTNIGTLSIGPANGGYKNSRITGPYIAVMNGGDAIRLNSSTGQIMDTQSIAPGTTAVSSVFDAATSTIVWTDNSGRVRSFQFDRLATSTDDVPVSQIVSDLCEACGLEPADYDVSDIAGNFVRGFIANRQTSARDTMQPLSAAFFFDGVETDYTLKFVSRGNASVRTITQEDMLAPNKDGEYFKTTHGEEIDFPRRFNVNFLDAERDYGTNSQKAQRMLAPAAAMASQLEATMELPAVIHADQGKQIAERALYSMWAERDRYSLGLAWTHIDLDPTDVVTFSLSDGNLISRLQKIEIGADYILDVSAVQDQQSAYTSNAVADGGDDVLTNALKNPLTNLFVLNMPLLRDEDDEARSNSVGYTMAGGYGFSIGWTGCLVMRASDGISYTPLDGIGASLETAWGTTVAALPDRPLNEMFSTDNDNDIRLYMVVGGDRLVSVTQLQMVEGANRAAIIKTNGEIELIGFRDVTLNGDGSYTLSGILRGQRGTDTMAYGHLPGETFVLIDEPREVLVRFPTSALNTQQYFRGVGGGQRLEQGDLEQVTWGCRDLKPYAPVNVQATENAGDIDIVWDRRTRIGGGLFDSTGDVPLNEDAESYSIDIYDALGENVIRTLTSSTETVTYDSADITTDFGSPPATLTLAVYQVSAQVGRGFAHIVEVEVL